jgi:hypothetical protein
MWVVYLITCKKCAAQGVGSTKTLKPRIAKYKTTITRRKTGDCGVDWHFLKDDHTWEDFEIQVIAQLEKIPRNKAQEKEAFCRLRRFEGYWQMQLSTIAPHGMNEISEFHRNRFSQEKPAFNQNMK